jgi:hypothetical protein
MFRNTIASSVRGSDRRNVTTQLRSCQFAFEIALEEMLRRETAVIDSIVTSTNRSISRGVMDRGGMRTMTFPSGRRMTPRFLASRMTRWPILSFGG